MSAGPFDEGISLCALVPYPAATVPGQRFRIEQWQSRLAAAGISVDLHCFAGDRLMALLHQPGRLLEKGVGIGVAMARRTGQIALAARYDAILVHRSLYMAGPSLLERALSLARRPVIFDFDDAVHLLHTSAANRAFGWLKFPGKTAALCRLSREVVVGNAYLADYARRYNSRVTIVPSSIDTDWYRPVRKQPHDGPVIIGWMGSSTSQAYLEMFAPMLRRLSAPGVELRVVSDRPPELRGVSFVWHAWSAERETAELAEFDVGIMPMPDDPWSRGKCAMKALQYMGMAVPSVCSDVGANREVIRHGHNGLLAANEDDWLAHLRLLVGDPALRRHLGDAGRRTVEQRYSAAVCAAELADVVRRAIKEPGVRAA
jgi:glycosyltransferase involved in cell wall biosynthesis